MQNHSNTEASCSYPALNHLHEISSVVDENMKMSIKDLTLRLCEIQVTPHLKFAPISSSVLHIKTFRSISHKILRLQLDNQKCSTAGNFSVLN